MLESEWKDYPHDYIPPNIDFYNNMFRIEGSVVESLGMEEWMYVNLSYNERTKQFRIKRADVGNGIKVEILHEPTYHFIPCNIKEFFKLPYNPSEYYSERMDDCVILTPN